MIEFYGFLCLSFSQGLNALCDAVNFSGLNKRKKFNHWWHVFKWFGDRPLMFFAGVFFSDIVLEQLRLMRDDFYYYAWHYVDGVYFFAAALALSFFVWAGGYKFFRNYIRRELL